MKTLITRVLPVFLFAILFNPLYAQLTTTTGAEVSEVRFLGKTEAVRDIAIIGPANITAKKKLRKSNFAGPDNFSGTVPMPQNNPNPRPQGIDPVRQINSLLNVVFPVEPLLNFEGVRGNDSGVSPPDTNGDVSPDHFVQTVNGGGSLFNVFDKDGELIMGLINMNTFWTDFNLQGLGDPVILWDQEMERWIFSEVAANFSSVLIAISETSDPLGAFYSYEFQTPDDLPDYPKYGIWNNAYYFTINDPGDDNIPIYILDRAAMINGESNIDLQRVSIPKFPEGGNTTFQVCTAADWDGATSPPAGSPAYILRMYDDAWDGGDDKLEVWEIDVDWNDPTNTTVSGPTELITEPFDGDLCNGSIFDCLTDVDGNTVSALMHVIMHRVQYRNFGSHESMVLNHVVDVDGNNLAGVRWYELRKSMGGDWEIYQQGTISPDNNNRYMASIAMDAAGSIGLGYTIMGPDHNYSLAFTGRRAGDPLGTMTVDENIFAEGLSTNPQFGRWGDYSMMTVDETDGRTFWYTGEYMKENSEWGTRVVSFVLRRDTIDVGPFNIVSPQTSGLLTDSEVVEVEVKNFGLQPQADFEVVLNVDDVFIGSQTISDTLQPDSIVNVVFSNTVDMSAIGDYDFKIYTNLMGDGNTFNDTIRQIISKTPRFDLSVSQFINIDQSICDSTHEIGIVLTNVGFETISTGNVEWSLNGAAAQLVNWTGNLVTGASDTIYITVAPLLDGTNTISATSSLPNGMNDEEMSNDNLMRDFIGVVDGGALTFSILTDDYPNETTWQLEDDMGVVLFEGGPYPAIGVTYTEQWCVPDGCYTFRIFDSFGDGLSEGAGGTYSITDANGIILASLINLNFGGEEVNEFCSPFMCTLDGSATTMMETGVGAMDGVINITQSNGTGPFQYSIDGGVNFQSNSIFNGLSGGIYDIVISDVNGCTVEFQVTVESCTLLLSAEVNDAIGEEMNGSVTVITENGAAPFVYSINGGVTNQASNTFENLGAGVYQITVTDAIGCESVIDITIGSMVNTNETYFGNNIEVFPNPTEGKFKINVRGIQGASTMNIRMLDASGKVIQYNRLVRYGDTLTGFLSLRNFPVGIYFVEFEHKDIQRIVKIVKQ